MSDIESAVFVVLLIVVWFHELVEVSDGPLNREYNLMAGLSLAAMALPLAESIAKRQVQFGLFLTAPLVLMFGLMWFINHFVFRGVMKISLVEDRPKPVDPWIVTGLQSPRRVRSFEPK